jgi:hypothetical protein
MNLTDREMLIKVWGMLEKFDMVGGKELAKEIKDHLEKAVVPPKISIREPFNKDNNTPCKPIPMPPYVWPYQKWEPSNPIYFKRTAHSGTISPSVKEFMSNADLLSDDGEYKYKMANTYGTITNLDNYLYDQKNP